uniref:Uncharacterized protein n=1 Tax=Rhizophagus irregularis (strain DAOM 181602 / DAOM 197198 / MUCL 43194) TaxID=747089 RepID=U9TR79_RHIID
MEPSVPLVKFVKKSVISRNSLYYDHPFQTPIPIHQDFTYVPLYHGSVRDIFNG